MTALVWDQLGERRYEAGCDRGVLYLPDGTAAVWNGLTSVDEDFSDTVVEEFYLDGVKYLNRRIVGDYSGTIKALTYPDEFLQFEGFQEAQSGLFVTGQQVTETFGLSYRTKIGNDLDGLDFGYKIHLLYNLTAIPDATSFGTQTASAAGEEFSWKLSGVPVTVPGYRPTCHVVLDSTRVPSNYMAVFEAELYGNENANASLPDISTMLDALQFGDVIMEPITEPI